MKNISKLVPALFVAGVLTLTPLLNRAKAEPGRPIPGAVVFGAQEVYQNGYPTGYIVYVVSRSSHAPQISPGMDLATAFETLLLQGYDIQEHPGFHFIALRK